MLLLAVSLQSLPEAEVAEARKLYLERHANSKYWVDFEDFSFYRMDVIDDERRPQGCARLACPDICSH